MELCKDYRAKRKDNGEWVFGSHFYGYMDYCWQKDPVMRHWIVGYTENSTTRLGVIHFNVEVDPETLGRWTGFVDKNKTLIYEGDVLKDELDYRNYTVIWYKSGWALQPKVTAAGKAFQPYMDDGEIFMFTNYYDCEGSGWYEEDLTKYEIIGNIHNKEGVTQ